MSLTNVFEIAGSAIAAQSERLNTVASNIANADSAAAAGGNVYRAKQVVRRLKSLGRALSKQSQDGSFKSDGALGRHRT